MGDNSPAPWGLPPPRISSGGQSALPHYVRIGDHIVNIDYLIYLSVSSGLIVSMSHAHTSVTEDYNSLRQGRLAVRANAREA